MAESTTHNVLVVEDDASVRQFVTRVLRDRGCQVVEAANAWQAIYHMQQTYDLVILDIRMPYTIKGTDLLDTLETLGNDTPVIVFSGFPEDLDERHKERVVKILEKPVNLVDFVSCVESVLQSN